MPLKPLTEDQQPDKGQAGKQERLLNLLSALSDELAEQLAIALERDRVMGGSGLPIDEILAGLRPKLRQRATDRRHRLPTPERAFFQVFDGLIADGESFEKKEGRIARPSLTPIWAYLIGADAAASAPLVEGVAGAILAGDGAILRERLGALDVYVLDLIRKSLKEADQNGRAAKKLADSLGGPRAIDSLREMGRVLPIAAEIRELMDEIGRDIRDVQGQHFGPISVSYEKVIERAPAAAAYLLLAIAARFQKPWDLFGLAAKLAEAADDKELEESELGLVGERLVADLEADAAALKALRPAEFDPSAAIIRLKQFAALQAGMTKQVGMRKDGHWGKRLLKCRGVVSTALEQLLERAANDIKDAFPMIKGSGGAKAGRLVPKIDKSLDPILFARAVALASFIADARAFASQLGYGVAHDRVRSDIAAHADDFADGLIDLLLHAKRKEREIAMAYATGLQSLALYSHAEDARQVLCRRLNAAALEASKKA